MERTREFTVVVQQDAEGYCVADVPELRGCYTQATSLDELMDRIREAIQVCLDEGNPVPPARM